MSKSETIQSIEQKMRYLFNLPFINSDVVNQYNELERRWKVATKYSLK
jgi:hypothetical protein